MHYQINIGHEYTTRLDNARALSAEELLTLITKHAQYDDVIQVTILEELAALDGFGPLPVRVGSFASYFNGKGYSEFMERFHCTGQGLALYEELCRLAKEQARKTA
jgi:hypothetical protein